MLRNRRILNGAFDVPYRSLLPQGVDNLIVAGRCMSATHFAHGATRNMAPCLVTGQTAGTAAAMAAKRNTPLAELDTRELQHRLAKDGAYLWRAFERSPATA